MSRHPRPDHPRIVRILLSLAGFYTARDTQDALRRRETGRARADAYLVAVAVVLDCDHAELDEAIAQATVGMPPETWDDNDGRTFAVAVTEHLTGIGLLDPDPIAVELADLRRLVEDTAAGGGPLGPVEDGAR